MARQVWNRYQLERAIEGLVVAQLDLQRAQYVRDEMIKKAQEDFERATRKLRQKMGPIKEQIEAYLRTDGDEILNGRKSIQIGRAIIGFRFGKAMLVDRDNNHSVEKEEIVVRVEQALNRATGDAKRQLEETLQTETKPLLSVIKNLPPNLLGRLGLELEQTEEFFWKPVK